MTQSINERLEYTGAEIYHSGHSVQELRDIIQDTEYTGSSKEIVYRSSVP